MIDQLPRTLSNPSLEAPVSGVAILDLDLSAKNGAQLQHHGLPPIWRNLWQHLCRAGCTVDFLHPGRHAVGRGVQGLPARRFQKLIVHVDNFLPPHLDAALGKLKAAMPDLEILACGYLATVEPAVLLERLPAVDAVVRGPLEATLIPLARALSGRGTLSSFPGYQQRATSNTTSSWETSKRPVIAGEDLGMNNPGSIEGLFPAGVGIVQGSAGCPYQCAFCRTGSFYRAYSRNPYALRPLDSLAQEIGDLAHRGLRHFKLYDNNFLGTPELARRRARDFAAALSTLGRPITFELHCRTDAVTAEVLEPLCEAGLRHLALGLESMAPTQLARFQKRATVEDHHRAVGLVAAFGLLAQGYTILTDPLVTREELAQSLAGLMELSDHILILIHDRMILYRTSPYYLRHRHDLLGAKSLPSSLHTVVDYELRDPWCRAWFPLVQEASQRFKQALLDFQRRELPELSGVGLHRFIKAGTRIRLGLLQRLVACDEPVPNQAEAWLAAAEQRIPSIVPYISEILR